MPRKGQVMSAEQRALIAKAITGIKRSGETRRKIGLASAQRSHTAEVRVKISQSVRASMTDESRARRSETNKARVTPELRVQMSASRRGRPVSPDHRRKLSEAWTPERRASHGASLLGNTWNQDAPIKGECVYCGALGTTYDHVIPRGRVGWDDPANLVPACRSCNSSKGDRTPDEWLQEMARAW